MRHLFAVACAWALAAPAFALDFRINSETGVIYGSGAIEIEDAEKIQSLVTLEYKQTHRLVRMYPTLRLDSPGGNMLGGLRLGYALRDIGIHTEVPNGAKCFSACAMAFLGGAARTVEGQFGVHAVNIPSSHVARAQENLGGAVDSIQKLSAFVVAYVTAMTGRQDMAIKALATSASDIAILSDDELSRMHVITLARRPSQFAKTGFKCPSKVDHSVLFIICSNIDIAALDVELNELYTSIKREGAPPGLAREQQIWRNYRNSCVNHGRPNGFASIISCVRQAYLVRRDELKSIWLWISASKQYPASDGWKPVPQD